MVTEHIKYSMAMIAVVVVLIAIVGCTQTATVMEPMAYGCVVSCKPGEECRAEFNAIDEIGEDKSILIGDLEPNKTGED